jgi:hypothetical protein
MSQYGKALVGLGSYPTVVYRWTTACTQFPSSSWGATGQQDKGKAAKT